LWLCFQLLVPLITLLYIVFFLGLLVAQSFKGNRLAQFYLVAVGTMLVMTTFQLLYYSGNWQLQQSFYGKFALAIAFIAEVIIVTAGLVYRFNQYRIEKEKLLTELNRRQQENTRIMMEVQEAERDQIANQLHDVAGSLLSAARLNLSSLREHNGHSAQFDHQLMKAEEAISIVSETVRNLSHALSPIMLQKAGFKTALEKIVAIFNASGKINIELVVVGFDDEHEALHSVYTNLYSIVYELLNNIVKHAHATHALVQVIEHEEAISVMVEDDGVGMSLLQQSSMGLAGIRSKVEYYKGALAFDKNNPTGLITTIEIPIPHEVQADTSR